MLRPLLVTVATSKFLMRRVLSTGTNAFVTFSLSADAAAADAAAAARADEAGGDFDGEHAHDAALVSSTAMMASDDGESMGVWQARSLAPPSLSSSRAARRLVSCRSRRCRSRVARPRRRCLVGWRCLAPRAFAGAALRWSFAALL